MKKRLSRRLEASREVAVGSSRTLWLNHQVPVEMCIKQGAIIRRWNELQTLLGGVER